MGEEGQLQRDKVDVSVTVHSQMLLPTTYTSYQEHLYFALSKLTLGGGVSAVVGRGFGVRGFDINAHSAGQLGRGVGRRCHLDVSGAGGGIAVLIGAVSGSMLDARRFNGEDERWGRSASPFTRALLEMRKGDWLLA